MNLYPKTLLTNTRSTPPLTRILPLALAVLSAIAGCQNNSPQALSCDEDTRADPYRTDQTERGTEGYTLRLISSTPGPPQIGDNRWVLGVRNPTGQNAPGLELEVSSLMVDHDHRSPIRPTIVDDGDGRYVVDPVNLFMPGYWEITISLWEPRDSDAQADPIRLDTVVFKVCVRI